MKTLTTAISTLLIATASMTSFTTTAAMDSYMEQALISTCKAAMSNKTLRLKATLKEYRLSERTAALGIVCNGEDIITFAENRGATKTADHMNKSIGKSVITDIAEVQYEVNFPVSPK